MFGLKRVFIATCRPETKLCVMLLNSSRSCRFLFICIEHRTRQVVSTCSPEKESQGIAVDSAVESRGLGSFSKT